MLIVSGQLGAGRLLGLEDPYRPTLERRGTLRVLDTVVDGSLPAALRGRVTDVREVL